MELRESVAREKWLRFVSGFRAKGRGIRPKGGGHFWDAWDRWIGIDGEELLGSERLFACNL